MVTYLNDVADIDEFKKQCDMGLITSRPAPWNENVRVYCYTRRVQFEGLWTRETLLARGLILEHENGADSFEGARVVARGISKFFTAEWYSDGSDWAHVKFVDDDENVTVSERVEVELDTPAFVADKLDGSMIVLFLGSDGELHCASKGSLNSDASIEADRLIHESYNYDELKNIVKSLNDETLLFEVLIHGQHPVDYGIESKLVFLGRVRNSDGWWTPGDDEFNCLSAGVNTAEVMSDVSTLREALNYPYRPNTEGFVVTYVNKCGAQQMVKVKTKEFLAVRKLFHKTRRGDIFEIVSSIPYSAARHFESAADVDLKIHVTDEMMSYKNVVKLLDDARETAFKEFIGPAQRLFDVVVYQSREDLESLADSDNIMRDYAKIVSKRKDKALMFLARDVNLGTKSRAREDLWKLCLKEVFEG